MSVASDVLLRRLGWRAMLFYGDPFVLDRWRWLRSRPGLDIRRVEPPRRMLDAGCGNGVFAFWAASRGNDVLGLSDTPRDLAKARARASMLSIDGIGFQEYDLRALAQDGERLGEFDAILCLEVVEHVLDDVELLRRLGRRLRPGGLIYLSTPTHDHRPLFGERAHLSGIEDGRHVRWGYSREQLADVLCAAGLEPVEFAVFGGYLTQRLCGLLWRLERISLPLAWGLTLPLRSVALIDRVVTQRLGKAFMSLGAVARKPA